MGYILKYKLWESKIHERSNLILEQKASLLRSLVDEAKATDPVDVKSIEPTYTDVMDWWARGKSESGKQYNSNVNEKVLKTLRYWTGDMSDKTSNKDIRAQNSLQVLIDDGGKALMSTLGYTKQERNEMMEPIKVAAQALKDAIIEMNNTGMSIGAIYPPTYGGKKNDHAPIRYTLKSGKNTPVSFKKPGEEETKEYAGKNLGVLPIASNNVKKYKGKIDGSIKNTKKYFDAWYDQITKDGGVADLIEKINNSDYHNKTKSYVPLTEKDKITILNGIQKKADGFRKPKLIADATRIYIWPEKAKWIEKSKETEWTTETADVRWPLDPSKAKDFFQPDSSTIGDTYRTDFIAFLNGLLQRIRDDNNGEIESVTIRAESSTNAVPSTLFHNRGGNVALVNARIGSMLAFATEALTADGTGITADMIEQDTDNPNLTLPNNPACGGWDDELTDKEGFTDISWKDYFNRDTDGVKYRDTVKGKAEYELKYAGCRWAWFQIFINYKTKTPETITKFDQVGEWEWAISWGKQNTGGGGGGRPKKNPPVKNRNSFECPSFGKDYGSWFLVKKAP